MQRRFTTLGRLCLLVLVMLAAASAFADTIVLKNGRRIVALSVVEDGDKVRYETSAGSLSLPKSIVDHIEKGGAVPIEGGPAGAAQLAITPPPVEWLGGPDLHRDA